MPNSRSESSAISSAISNGRRNHVTTRDNSACVVCGIDQVDVAHIVARAGDLDQVAWIRKVAPSLTTFRKDDADNLICLCPTHHRHFHRGLFVLVPSQKNREILIALENADYASRQISVQNGRSDPGRALPVLQFEFEYIPISAIPFRASLHIPTRYDTATFIFDNRDNYPCPVLHFEASFIALMVQAHQYFGIIHRFRNPRVDLAVAQVHHLMELYNRHPSVVLDPDIVVPADYPTLATFCANTNSFPISHSLSSIPGSPPSPGHSPGSDHHVTLNGVLNETQNEKPTIHQQPPEDFPALIPSSSMSTSVSSEVVSSPVCNESQAIDAVLEAYSKEPVVTWKDIESRPRLRSDYVNSIWRFSSAEDIIRRDY